MHRDSKIRPDKSASWHIKAKKTQGQFYHLKMFKAGWGLQESSLVEYVTSHGKGVEPEELWGPFLPKPLYDSTFFFHISIFLYLILFFQYFSSSWDSGKVPGKQHISVSHFLLLWIYCLNCSYREINYFSLWMTIRRNLLSNVNRIRNNDAFIGIAMSWEPFQKENPLKKVTSGGN